MAWRPPIILAKECGITNVAVLEKGWIGGGNTGRNTTAIRSNYLFDESARLYEHSVKLWEGLSQDLNYNVMFSQRGMLGLVQTVGEVRAAKRLVNALNLNGIDSEWLEPADVKAFCPIVNISPRRALPGCWARRCSAAAARPATMRWPGALRGRHRRAASTLSRIAR